MLETVIESRTNVFTARGSQSVFGDGYVEAVGNSTLQQIAALFGGILLERAQQLTDRDRAAFLIEVAEAQREEQTA